MRLPMCRKVATQPPNLDCLVSLTPLSFIIPYLYTDNA